MIPFLKALLWDQAAARAVIMAAVAAGGFFYAQPSSRSLEERIIGSIAGALLGGGAGLPSGRSKAAEEELAELRARLDAISGPKPGP